MNKMMMIVNPASANGRTGKRWPAMVRQLEQSGLSFEYQLTTGPFDAIKMTRNALDAGFTTIVSVGGDGTLNEVVNGFFENDRQVNPEARLGVISCGTGSDFIRSAGISKEIHSACRMLERGRTWNVDVGCIKLTNPERREEKRYYLNIAGMGFDADTVDKVNHTSKMFGGKLSFLWGTLISLIRFQPKYVRLEIDGMLRYQGKCVMIAIANGKYFGGGMKVAPEASLDNGRFDIIVVDDMTKLEIIASLPMIYKGTHLSHPRVYMMRGNSIRAVSNERVLLDLDGEQYGSLNADFSILPKAMRLIC